MTPLNFLFAIFILTSSCGNSKTETPFSKDTSTNINDVVDSIPRRIMETKTPISYSDNYDTSLKGGYSLSYYSNSTDQFIIYRKGQKVIDTIGNCSIGLPFKNLGYLAADFDNTFVFMQSFASSNPRIIQLYNKETVTNLIKEFSVMIDVDTIQQVLLYSENDVPTVGDKMILFDTKKLTKNKYEFPKEIFNEPEICNRIRLKNVSSKTFTIEYEFNDRQNTKLRQYSR